MTLTQNASIPLAHTTVNAIMDISHSQSRLRKIVSPMVAYLQVKLSWYVLILMNVNKGNVLESVLIVKIVLAVINVIVQLDMKEIPLFLALTSMNVLLMIRVMIKQKNA